MVSGGNIDLPFLKYDELPCELPPVGLAGLNGLP
jgi:hypothetical protein